MHSSHTCDITSLCRIIERQTGVTQGTIIRDRLDRLANSALISVRRLALRIQGTNEISERRISLRIHRYIYHILISDRSQRDTLDKYVNMSHSINIKRR